MHPDPQHALAKLNYCERLFNCEMRRHPNDLETGVAKGLRKATRINSSEFSVNVDECSPCAEISNGTLRASPNLHRDVSNFAQALLRCIGAPVSDVELLIVAAENCPIESVGGSRDKSAKPASGHEYCGECNPAL
jgi:hypothetical protein